MKVSKRKGKTCVSKSIASLQPGDKYWLLDIPFSDGKYTVGMKLDVELTGPFNGREQKFHSVNLETGLGICVPIDTIVIPNLGESSMPHEFCGCEMCNSGVRTKEIAERLENKQWLEKWNEEVSMFRLRYPDSLEENYKSIHLPDIAVRMYEIGYGY